MTLPATALENCIHCGTAFHPKGDEHFCCSGCQYVYELLQDGGYERFYELKGKTTLPPVGSRVFENSDFSWLADTIQKTEASCNSMLVEHTLGIEGISCVGCVWLIEAIFKEQPGAVESRIDTNTGTLCIKWQKAQLDSIKLGQALARIGYRLTSNITPCKSNATRGISYRLGLCGFLVMNTMLFTLPNYLGMPEYFFLAPLFEILAALFASLSLVCGGSYFIVRAWQSIRKGVLHIDLPIALGLVVAYIGSLLGWLSGYTKLIYFDFVATFVFLMLAGRWLQEFLLEQSRRRLSEGSTKPRGIRITDNDGSEKDIQLEAITSDMQYTVKPGEVVPVTSDLVSAEAQFGLEWINGESEPTHWKRGKPVPAGAINLSQNPITLNTCESWQESLLAKLLQPIKQSFADQRLQRVIAYYIAAVIFIATVGGVAWWAATGSVLLAAQILISILVVSCPCALGVALPVIDELAVSRLREAGLFVRASNIWGRLRRVKTVVFDKTGTLTLETPVLLNPGALNQLNELQLARLGFLTKHNLHPVCRSLRASIMLMGSRIRNTRNDILYPIHEAVGTGIHLTDENGDRWSLERTKSADTNDNQPASSTTFLYNDTILATFHFSDAVREDAFDAINYMRHQGRKIALLSGDNPARVKHIANLLDIAPDRALAECSPQAKAEWIKKHARDSALMIGDGANDRLAFNAAVCRGTPVVDRSLLEHEADFFFFGRSLRCLPLLMLTERKRTYTTSSVFAFAVAYNICAIGLCLSGWMHPLLAAVLMPASSLVTLALAWGGMLHSQTEDPTVSEQKSNLHKKT